MSGWNGSGVYIRDYNWQNDAAANIPITASRMQPDTQDIADKGFGNCLTRDGQGFATANLPMAGFRHTGVSNGVAVTDYSAVGQVQNGSLLFSVGGGTGDAITGTYAPVLTTLPNGITLYVSALGGNTVTNPTFSPNGLTARTITKRGGSALIVGEYATGQRLQLQYDLPNTRWELISSASVSTTVSLDTLGSAQGDLLYRNATVWTVLAPGTAGQVLQTNGAGANPSFVTLAAAPVTHGQKFSAGGTFTVPAGTLAATIFKFTVVGAGAGGGGSSSPGAGSGGGAGGVGIAWLSGFTALASVTIAIGTGGAAGNSSGGNGADGGISKITYATVDVISCSGGIKGIGSSAAAGVAGGVAGTPTIAVGVSGLTLIDSTAGLAMDGGGGISWTGPNNLTGYGGSTAFGAGGRQMASGSGGPALAGTAGVRGGGGSGGLVGSAGGAGGDGFVLVEWVL